MTGPPRHPSARRGLIAALLAVVALGAPLTAAAQTVTEFPLLTTGASAYSIAKGPDGALWFTEYIPNKSLSMPGSASKIGRVATDGTITEFVLPTATSFPSGITAGPDGAMWFVETNSSKIGRITTDGTITEFPISFPASPTLPTGAAGAITVGSDGALWFPVGDVPSQGVGIGTAVVGRIATDGTMTAFTISNGGVPEGIAAGPDGALWITGSACCGVHAEIVSRLTTAGVGTEVSGFIGSAGAITSGPDGALWVAAPGFGIEQFTTSGGDAEFNASDGGFGIAPGPDGALWFGSAITGINSSTGAIGRITTSKTIINYAIPTSQNTVEGVTTGPDGAMWFAEAALAINAGTGAIGRISVPANTSPLVAAVLPSGRSVQVGSTATAFATIINSGSSALTGCAIAPVTGVPASFLYQTTIASNNALTGTANTPVSIPAHGSQSFFLAFTTSAPFVPTDTVLGFDCANTDAAISVSGLNTILLSGSATPVPDVIALSATPSGDGTLHIPGSKGMAAFAVATTDVGTGGQMTMTVDTGAVVLPLTLTFCQTDPTTGQCIGAVPASVPPQPPPPPPPLPSEASVNFGGVADTATPVSASAATVSGAPVTAATAATSIPVSINAGATPTFSIFATATGAIPFAPQTSRIFFRFLDSNGVQRGSTSVAVTTQ